MCVFDSPYPLAVESEVEICGFRKKQNNTHVHPDAKGHPGMGYYGHRDGKTRFLKTLPGKKKSNIFFWVGVLSRHSMYGLFTYIWVV